MYLSGVDEGWWVWEEREGGETCQLVTEVKRLGEMTERHIDIFVVIGR